MLRFSILSRSLILCGGLFALLTSACWADRAPSIHKNASIQWEDMHFQVKPDGIPMYLASIHDVLIEGARFSIQAPDGSVHSNLLPWEIKQQVTDSALRINEPIRIKAARGNYRVETSLVQSRELRGVIDFKAEGYCAKSLSINLPLHVYAGKRFIIDGQTFDYSTLEVAQSMQRQVLFSRRSFSSFTAIDDSQSAFSLKPNSDLEIELLSMVDWKGHRSYWVNLYPIDGGVIDYQLSLPDFDAAALAAFDAQRPQNILPNSSFELGREEWGVIFGKFDVSSKWSIDSSTASHGAHALRVDLVPQTAAYEAEQKGATIASDYFQGRPLERLTISADLKASKAGRVVNLQLRYVPVALVPNRGSDLIEKTITLTDDWQRYSFDVRLPLAAKDAYAISIEVPARKDAVAVYLDAVTVTGVGQRKYQSQHDIEALSDTQRYRRIYEPGEAFDLTTYVRNDSQETSHVTSHLEVRNDQGAVLHKAKAQIVVNPAQNNMIDWQVPAFVQQGMYRIKVQTEASDAAYTCLQSLSLGMLRERSVDEVNPSNRFGANITDLREFWALERIGIGWSRFTFDCGLGRLMHRPGQWDQAQADSLSALLDYQATFGVTPLAVLGPGIPKWASRAPKGSSVFRTYTPKESAQEYFVDYLNRLLEMANGRLHAIETWNEPDIPLFYRGTAGEMAEFSTLAYNAIKAKEPSIEVVGLGLATPSETHNRFLRRVLAHTGLEPYDAISFHPYTEGRRHPMRGEFREMVEGFHAAVADFGEVPSLWSTEFGYFGLAEDAKPFVPFKNPFVAREILDEEESAEAYIQAICTSFANGVDKTFYFILLEGNLLDRWLHGWVGPGGRSVESGFIAAAVACDHMNGVDCLGQDEIADGHWQTRFANEDREFVVLWSESGESVIKLQSIRMISGWDLYGKPLSFEPVSGIVQIPIKSTPIYLNIKDIKEFL